MQNWTGLLVADADVFSIPFLCLMAPNQSSNCSDVLVREKQEVGSQVGDLVQKGMVELLIKHKAYRLY